MADLTARSSRHSPPGRDIRATARAALLMGSCLTAATWVTAARAQDKAQDTASSTVQLDTIDVQGRAMSAYGAATGPMTGFTAAGSTVGTKTATPIERTPASVSVVGRDQIRDTGSTTIPEALRFTPGVRSDTFGFDPRLDFFLIRGFEADDSGYYLDGLPLLNFGFATFQTEPWGLDRIDVLRGPASSLYGGGGPGGIVDAISKRPLFEQRRQIEVGVNSFGNAYGAFDLTGPVTPDGPWAYRLVGLGRGGGTQVDHIDFDRGYIAPSFTYQPDAGTSLTLLGQYQRDFTSTSNFLPYKGTVVSAPFGRIPTSTFTGDTALQRYTREQGMVGYEFEHKFASDIIVRQNFRFAYVGLQQSGLYGEGYVAPPTAISALLSRENFYTGDTGNQVALDNQIEAFGETWGLKHDVLLGLDYRHFVLHANNGEDQISVPFDLLNYNYGVVRSSPTSRYNLATQVQDQVGLYAQDQMSFGALDLTLSGRQDFVDATTHNRLDPYDTAENTPSRLTGRMAALYNTDWGVNPYAAYATSFNPVLGTNSSTGSPFLPEDGEQEEVGLKYKTPGLPITASLALFNLVRSNVLTTDPDNENIQYQTGQERSQGIELGLNATLADGFNIVSAFTAYDIRVTKDLNPAIVGKVPVAVPSVLGSVFADYTIPSGAWRGIGFGAGERYVGSSYATDVNDFKVPDYWLTDAALHYERDGYRLALNVQNLFDKTYVASCDSLSTCYYGDRRRITASLSYTW